MESEMPIENIQEITVAKGGWVTLDYSCHITVKKGEGEVQKKEGLEWEKTEPNSQGVYTPPIRIAATTSGATFAVEKVEEKSETI